MKDERATDVLSDSPEATFSLGEKLAAGLRPGAVVAIRGELGSGKTVLVQGICSGLGVTGFVTSPTFTLIQEYPGRFQVYHFDFYRLQSLREIEDLDLERYFESGGISLIEWAERAGALLPEGRIDVAIERKAEDGKPAENVRRIRIEGPAGRARKK
jgi:tRNA threonylcarbamoyladenosine biosynthesis protein TsaE